MMLELTDSVGSSTDGAMVALVAVGILAVLLLLAGGWAVFAIRRRHLVDVTSVALKQLSALNLTYEPLTRSDSPIECRFSTAVSSKPKFDRFDLPAFVNWNLLENEHWFELEIGSRLAKVEHYRSYELQFDAIAREQLGRSSHARVHEDRYRETELRMFGRRKLKYPAPSAKVRSTVTYTSPKGQNSYSRSLDLEFEQLRACLRRAQEQRSHQTTAQFLRQRERGLMTDRLRVQILRRDEYRCRMCGASAREGAQLHVDHILPVSHGGQTVPNNLQALCRACNLGKSNTFVG